MKNENYIMIEKEAYYLLIDELKSLRKLAGLQGFVVEEKRTTGGKIIYMSPPKLTGALKN